MPTVRVVAILLPLLFLAPAGLAHETQEDGVTLSTASATYAWPERPFARSICFLFTNDAHASVTLPNGAPWRILDEEGAVAYVPWATQAQWTLAQGRSYGGCWRGQDSLAGGYVPFEGTYTIVFDYVAAGVGRNVTLDFALEGP